MDDIKHVLMMSQGMTILNIIDKPQRMCNIFRKSGLAYQTVESYLILFRDEKILDEKIVMVKKKPKKFFMITDKGIALKGLLFSVQDLLDSKIVKGIELKKQRS